MARAGSARTKPGARKAHLDPVSARRLGLIIGLVAVVLGAWAFRVAASERTTRYLATTDALQAEHEAEVDKLNSAVAEFGGDPVSAAEAADAFLQLSSEFEQIRESLAEVEPPTRAAEYQSALETTYESYASWCIELAKVAEYIGKRAETLTALSESIAQFDSRVSEAGSNDDVIGASRMLASACHEALADIRALERPALLSYSSGLLEANVNDLAAATAMLAAGVEGLDLAATSSAATDLRGVLARDWALAVQETDLEGSARYAASQTALAEREEFALEARARLTTAR